MSDSSDDDVPLKQRVAKKKPQARKKPAVSCTQNETTYDLQKEKKAEAPQMQRKAKAKASPKSKAPSKSRRKKSSGEVTPEEEDQNTLPNDARRYFKEGQKFITPPNGDGTRGFYESLFEENKNSLVALRYVVEWGVLTGTLLHDSLPRYFALRDKGAFKGTAGGLQKAFMNGGLTEAEINAATKMLNAGRTPT
ncbi:hypothetical protein Esti_005144 [Eimeria stiedai]